MEEKDSRIRLREFVDLASSAEAAIVIEDKQEWCDIIEENLRHAGIKHVLTYQDGGAFLIEYCDPKFKFIERFRGFFMLDFALNGFLDGDELHRRMRDSGIKNPVGFMTSDGDITRASNRGSAGAVAVIDKGDNEHFVEHFRKILAHTKTWLSKREKNKELVDGVRSLNEREYRVFELSRLLFDPTKIADEMHMSVSNLQQIRMLVYDKVGITNGEDATKRGMPALLAFRYDEWVEAARLEPLWKVEETPQGLKVVKV